MALHLTPEPGDPGEPRVRQGRIGEARPARQRRLLRDGMQVIAGGAMICPGCELPIVSTGAVPAGDVIRCGFCDRAGPARDFLREDVFDTVANDVRLVARLG